MTPHSGQFILELIAALAGVGLIVFVLWEGFETIVLPRRVTRRFRLTRLFYRRTWRLWTGLVNTLVPARQRETWLSFYGPISLLLLLSLWAGGLVTGFALLHWATGSTVLTRDGNAGFLADLYMSGTNFFTLGIGDVTPSSSFARFLTVLEAGMGFGFLALVIGYLPALNQFFARREVSISLLDARAGSPPTAGEMLRRHGHERGMENLRQLLHEWERWAAEFLEGHLSYPVLAYFRSQHDNQSWLAALTAVLDTCALVIVGVDGACERQAELTFAMARHAVVDLSLVFHTAPREMRHDRLPEAELAELRMALAEAGLKLRQGEAADRRLAELREMYEPYVHSLALYFHIAVPPWFIAEKRTDNWQTSAWEHRHRLKKQADRAEKSEGGHF
jgi:hypothetical protein